VNSRIRSRDSTGAATLDADVADRNIHQEYCSRAIDAGIFSTSSSGTGDGAIQNAVTFALQPFSVTTAGNPTYLAIYATGWIFRAPPW